MPDRAQPKQGLACLGLLLLGLALAAGCIPAGAMAGWWVWLWTTAALEWSGLPNWLAGGAATPPAAVAGYCVVRLCWLWVKAIEKATDHG